MRPFLRSISSSAERISGLWSLSSVARVTVSGRHGQPRSSLFLHAAGLACISASGTRICLPFSRRSASCSLGVSYSTILAVPSGVWMTAFFLGARCLKSRYASNS